MGWHGRRVLVTGGAGYVGSHLVAALVERGDAVVVLDNLRTGHRAGVPAGARLRLARQQCVGGPLVREIADDAVALP